MCPYYDVKYEICLIYKTLHRKGDCNTNDYCMGKRYLFVDCPNYRKCKEVYGGYVPPPSKF